MLFFSLAFCNEKIVVSLYMYEIGAGIFCCRSDKKYFEFLKLYLFIFVHFKNISDITYIFQISMYIFFQFTC